MLARAGITFDTVPSNVDERAVDAPMIAGGASPTDIAVRLAEAKALAVAEQYPECQWVIGADQVLEVDGKRLTKPPDRAAARHQLQVLAGRTHQLHTAVAIARRDSIAWRHCDVPALTMRSLGPKEIDAYLDAVGETIYGSVGAYQIEGQGIQLFARVAGDYFSILGLPLLPLLTWLRSVGAIGIMETSTLTLVEDMEKRR